MRNSLTLDSSGSGHQQGGAMGFSPPDSADPAYGSKQHI